MWCVVVCVACGVCVLSVLGCVWVCLGVWVTRSHTTTNTDTHRHTHTHPQTHPQTHQQTSRKTHKTKMHMCATFLQPLKDVIVQATPSQPSSTDLTVLVQDLCYSDPLSSVLTISDPTKVRDDLSFHCNSHELVHAHACLDEVGLQSDRSDYSTHAPPLPHHKPEPPVIGRNTLS